MNAEAFDWNFLGFLFPHPLPFFLGNTSDNINYIRTLLFFSQGRDWVWLKNIITKHKLFSSWIFFSFSSQCHIARTFLSKKLRHLDQPCNCTTRHNYLKSRFGIFPDGSYLFDSLPSCTNFEVFENMNVNHNDRLEHPRDIKKVISETLTFFELGMI